MCPHTHTQHTYTHSIHTHTYTHKHTVRRTSKHPYTQTLGWGDLHVQVLCADTNGTPSPTHTQASSEDRGVDGGGGGGGVGGGGCALDYEGCVHVL